MKVEKVWQYQITAQERIALENVRDMAQKYIFSDEYKTIPRGIQQTFEYLSMCSGEILDNCTEE